MEADVIVGTDAPPSISERGASSTRIVGVGASAGGLEALRELVRNLPEQADLRIVVVQHLSPTHRSMLVSLLSRETRLPVVEIVDGMSLQAHTIHVTPPACHVRLQAGQLVLTPARTAGTPKPSVDDFFASLAVECGAQAVGIVLSGTGHDGEAGIRQLHAAGGTIIAQDPATARYDGMPQAAIDTQCVHHTLAPAIIGRDLAMLQPWAAEDQLTGEVLMPPMERISMLMRRTVGVEIKLYKENTLQRRLKRRMNAVKVADLASYADHLARTPDEIRCLLREMLISVTHFFRDAPAFAALHDALDQHLRQKADMDEVRIWVAGCASGEEAYTIAMLVAEIQREQGRQLMVRIFATDLDELAVDRARRGRFSHEALAKVPEALVSRYFADDKGELVASKPLRDLLIFSLHNLIGDPVFSRLDLISCRNVLIYFRPELQTYLLESYHRALIPGGLLLLGKSESTQHNSRLFVGVDEKNRLFRRMGARGQSGAARLHPISAVARAAAKPPQRERNSLFERLVRSMTGKVMPQSVLIDADLRVRHVFGDVSPWIGLGDGEFSTDLHKLAIRPLRMELRSLALRALREQSGFVEHVLQDRDLERPVRISVLRLEDQDDSPVLLLVSFKVVRARASGPSSQDDRDAAHHSTVSQLEDQLSSTREHLHTVIEELETSNEELQSLNEEMQSSNEELTSSNEELETANEELQSTNEELTTVNEELENKSRELFALTNDLLNVKNSIPHPVLVVDERSYIALFNEAAQRTFSLPVDVVGQSLYAIVGVQTALGDLNELTSDLRSVLETGIVLERQMDAGRSGLLTLSPYRSDDGTCSGVVLMLVDNTVLKNAERELLAAHVDLAEAGRFARQTIDALPHAVCVIDRDYRIISVNERWQRDMQSGGGSATCGLGSDYSAVCERAASTGDVLASEFLQGMRAVVASLRKVFVQEYPCEGPDGARWYVASITPFAEQDCQHWLVMHVDVTERKQQERTIELQSMALELDSGGVFIADAALPHRPIVYVNPALLAITGRRPEDLIGQDFATLFPGEATRLQAALQDDRQSAITLSLEAAGTERHVELALRHMQWLPGSAPYISGVLHDVTERVQAAAVLRDTIAHENLALSFAEIGSLEWNLRSGRLTCSGLQMQLLGLGQDAAEISHDVFRALVHPEDLGPFNDTLKFCLAGHSAFSLDFRILRQDSSVHWLRCRGNAKVDVNGTPVSVLCLTLDITSAKESELKARFLSHHDPLTGLANRALLEDRLQQAISAARRERRRVAVVFIDLDRFKEINDVLGHHAGDEVLKLTARRLADSTRKSDSVCRHSGDEFIVLLPGVHDEDEVARVIGKLSDALRLPHKVAGRELAITASIGIAVYPDDGETADVLIKNADAAMYQAKASGRNAFEFFSQNMNVQLIQRIETAALLRRCIIEEQLELHYQPQVNVADGEVVGVEALVRWRHPERGLLMPDDFIPDAEDADLIHEIGLWVLRQACAQNQAWQKEGLRAVPMAVNVSPLQFRKLEFIDHLEEVLRSTGLPAEFLELEITERALMNQSDTSAQALAACKRMGVRLSIDDFGTGHSSLTYLLRFPVQRIKIDRTFVSVAPEQRTAAAIVRTVIQLGHGLGQEIVAEGVETQEQLQLLRSEGCDVYQGYLCAPALSAAEFRRFLEPSGVKHRTH